MTKLESFMKYAQSLPISTQNEIVEGLLSALRDRESEHRLTVEEIEEIKLAVAEEEPIYAIPQEVSELLGYDIR